MFGETKQSFAYKLFGCNILTKSQKFMKNDNTLKIIESSLITIASLFPVASTIATGWNEYKNIIQQNNIQDILQKLSSKLEDIKDQVDNNYLNSNDFKSLLLKTCIYGQEEIVEEKRKALAIFLANSCLNVNKIDFSKNAVLETLVKLSEIEIFVLNIIYKETLNTNEKLKETFLGNLEYKPKELPIMFLSETSIIKKSNGFKELDILNTLEYLNSLGVIENIASRSSTNLDAHIDNFLKTKKFDDEHNKNIEKKYEYSLEKHYSISSLGVTIIRYIS
jgi:hypothetical protein